MKESEIRDTMKILGHKRFDVPQGAEIENEQLETAEETVTTETEVQEQAISEVAEPEEQETQEDEVEESEEERRTWKSSYNKLEQTTRQLAESNELLKRQNETLMQVMTGSSQQRTQPQPKKEPELSDFINIDDYEPSDATDPRTLSGQAYTKWQRALVKFDTESEIIKNQQIQEKNNKQKTILEAANEIANEFHEFRDPFTGKADINKIIQYFDEIGSPSNWIKLIKATKTSHAVPTKIGSKLGKPTSVSKATTSATTNKKEPEDVTSLRNIFGNNFQIPGNYSR